MTICRECEKRIITAAEPNAFAPPVRIGLCHSCRQALIDELTRPANTFPPLRKTA